MSATDQESVRQPIWPHPRELLRVGPHHNAHAPALRLGVSALLPAVILLAADRVDLFPYALLATTVAVYGRAHTRGGRILMQAQAATFLVGIITVAITLAALQAPIWVLVAGTALAAALATLAADRLRWSPPGALFATFAFGVAAFRPDPDPLPAVVATVGAALLTLMTTATALIPRDRHPQPPPPLVIPATITALHAGMCCASGLIAGTAAVLVGMSNPYWAVVSAVVPVFGISTSSQVSRALHRFLGTVAGLGLAGLLALAPLNLIGTLLVLTALLVCTELVIARNYSLAMLFITPAIIELSTLDTRAPSLGTLLASRLVETALGVAIAIVLVAAAHRPRKALLAGASVLP